MEDNRNFIVRIIENGPIHIKGIFTFKDSSAALSRNRDEIFICRCCESGNMPFCDCTHKIKS